MTKRKVLLSAGIRRPPARQSDPPLRAPYTFAPVVGTILPSPQGGTPDIGRPLAKAISGTLKVKWTAETPLLVGGVNNDNDRPFALGGEYALPGASLKGMLRAVLEIAAFGRLTFYDDYVGYTRNLNGSSWRKAVPLDRNAKDQPAIDGRSGDPHSQKGGWLLRRWEGKVWQYRLVPADTRLLEIDRIVEVLSGVADRNAWHELTARERLLALRTAPPLSVPKVQGHGMIVVAGQTPSVGRGADQGKKTEALFLDTGAKPQDIKTVIGDRFLASLDRDSNESRNAESYATSALYDVLGELRCPGFYNQGSSDEIPAPDFEEQVQNIAHYGLPLFWRVRGRTASQSNAPGDSPVLSLTAFMRVPFENSLEDVAQNTQRRSPQDPLDLVQGLFGWAPPDGEEKTLANRGPQERSLRSRVRFGFASSGEWDWPIIEKRMIGAKPRASFWPYYLRGREGVRPHMDYDNPEAILAGRKRYPARHPGTSGYDRRLPIRDEDQNQQDNELTFLQSGLSFTGEIRVRNLHPIEAGALLWAVRLGQRGRADGPLRHMLGRAKAFGYGQLRAEVVGGALVDEVGGETLDEDDAMRAFEEWVVKGLDLPEGTAFDDLDPIRVLRGAAHPQTGAELAEVLDFTAIDVDDTGKSQKQVEGAERVLRAYAGIKANAEHHKNAVQIELPPWPGYPPKA